MSANVTNYSLESSPYLVINNPTNSYPSLSGVLQGNLGFIPAGFEPPPSNGVAFPSLGNRVDGPLPPVQTTNGKKDKRTCAICHEEKLKRKWHKVEGDPTAWKCEACYSRARQTVAQTCAACHIPKRCKKWYTIRDSEDSTARQCRACYNKANQIEARKMVKQKCAICRKTKQSKYWYTTQDAEDPKARQCQACYDEAKELVKLTCAICHETKLDNHWFTIQGSEDEGARRCKACYKRAWKADRDTITKSACILSNLKQGSNER